MTRTKQKGQDGKDVTPTAEQFQAYQGLYEYFNQKLFNGALPSILLNFSRKSGTCGFFSPNRWSREDGTKTHEISINPVHIALDTFQEVCQTLVHEQAHLWQIEFGTPSRPGNHNMEWSLKMESIGLMPSDTGMPGGARVGQKMADYVIPGGPFDSAFRQLPEELRLPWKANEATLPPGALPHLTGGGSPEGTGTTSTPLAPAKNKIRYQCPKCKAKVWGKPGLQVTCTPCGEPFRSGE